MVINSEKDFNRECAKIKNEIRNGKEKDKRLRLKLEAFKRNKKIETNKINNNLN